MEYPTIERGVAQNMLERFQDGRPAPPDERHTKWVGDGARLEEKTIQAVLDSLEECKSQFPEDRLPQNQGRNFEREATPILHSGLDIGRLVAGDPGFWRWVTFFALDGSFRSIVDWRFSTSFPVAADNYGLGSIWEGLFARLWIIGDIGFNEHADDPYDLSRTGDQDFWRSHIIRQDYARSRNMARALIHFQFPDGRDGKPRLKVAEIRELVKRVRTRNSSIAFELMDGKDLLDFLERIRQNLSP
jgi:hypothetical protein